MMEDFTLNEGELTNTPSPQSDSVFTKSRWL